MNKKELTTQVAKQTGLTVANAAKCVDAVFHTIKENVVEGDSVTLQGFGSFSVSHRAARQGVNPATKTRMNIPARKVMRFSASKSVEIK